MEVKTHAKRSSEVQSGVEPLIWVGILKLEQECKICHDNSRVQSSVDLRFLYSGAGLHRMFAVVVGF